MPNLPGANLTVDAAAGANAQGTDLLCILAPVPDSADATPRRFGSAAAVYEQHGYCEAVEYCALHAQEVDKPFLFVGLPIDTAGAVGRQDVSGNTGTCVTTVSAGTDGVLQGHDGRLVVETGGTIGTDQIVLSLSCDGGRSYRRVRLGTANSYTVPYLGVSIAFAAGTLTAGETVHTWHGSGPRADVATGLAAAFASLASQSRQFRSMLLIGDLQDGTEAAAYLAQLDAYWTSSERPIFGRAQVYDREPQAALSYTYVRMSGAPTVTFAEVGGTADTITRSAGSFVTDGFTADDIITVSGAVADGGANNITFAAKLASVAALVLTADDDDLVDEGPIAGVSIVGVEALVFSAAADTVTRSRGSWLADGFRVGDSVTVADTVGNDGEYTVAAVTATVLDLGDGLADETIGADAVTITAGQTKAEWMAEADGVFEDIDDAPRISLGAGRARKTSAFSGWYLRQPWTWAVSLREYARELHVAPWRKEDGPTGWDLNDADGNLIEWDDRVDGGAACAARFTAARTWANGPNGAFVAMSLTRATDSSVLLLTHNEAVVNVMCQVGQAAAEKFVGRSPILNSDGTATKAWLARGTNEVDKALAAALLQNYGNEGPRASAAWCTLSTTDILTGPEAHLTGTLSVNLRGTIHTVDFTVKVQ